MAVFLRFISGNLIYPTLSVKYIKIYACKPMVLEIKQLILKNNTQTLKHYEHLDFSFFNTMDSLVIIYISNLKCP